MRRVANPYEPHEQRRGLRRRILLIIHSIDRRPREHGINGILRRHVRGI